jgi:hypothetical protein
VIYGLLKQIRIFYVHIINRVSLLTDIQRAGKQTQSSSTNYEIRSKYEFPVYGLYFWFSIWNSKKKSLYVIVLISQYFSIQAPKNTGIYHIVTQYPIMPVDWSLYTLLSATVARVFQLAIILKSVAGKILLQRWKQMIIDRRHTPML